MITYRLPLILTLIIVAVFNAQSQDRFYSPGFQPAVILNPAVAGIEGDGILRMVYMTQYPGQGFNLHSFSGSYDAFISVLHGGIAGYISNDYLGIINDIRGGFSYSYHLRASKDLYINAGLSASFQHRGINTVKMVLPDQIDPLQGVVLPSAEEISGRGRTIFDVGTGFVMISGNYLAGISVNHLARPDLEGSGSQESSLARRMTFFASGTFRIGKTIKTVIKPVIYFDVAGKEILAATGIVTATETVAVNTILMLNKAGDINLQSGLTFKKWSSLFFYNYCFNLTSANGLLPFSMYHEGGLAVSLYNVDKRKTVKTINLPEL